MFLNDDYSILYNNLTKFCILFNLLRFIKSIENL